MEVESHLRAVAADAMTRGLPQDQAEHEAVSRFGPPALVARKLRSAQGAGRLNRAVSTAWLLAGLAACGLGAAYLLSAWWHTWQTPNCYVALAYGCYTTGMLVTRITMATTIAAAGAALLLGRWLAVRYAALTSSWATPGILEALIPGRMQGHGGTEEIPG